jgi:hypothetical protein
MTTYNEKAESAEALITQIDQMKLKLVAKYGPLIRQKWARKERHNPAYDFTTET